MVSSFSASRPGSAMRESANTSAGASSRPFRVTLVTAAAITSMKVSAPGVPEKRTVVVAPNRSAPVVRSSAMS